MQIICFLILLVSLSVFIYRKKFYRSSYEASLSIQLEEHVFKCYGKGFEFSELKVDSSRLTTSSNLSEITYYKEVTSTRDNSLYFKVIRPGGSGSKRNTSGSIIDTYQQAKWESELHNQFVPYLQKHFSTFIFKPNLDELKLKGDSKEWHHQSIEDVLKKFAPIIHFDVYFYEEGEYEIEPYLNHAFGLKELISKKYSNREFILSFKFPKSGSLFTQSALTKQDLLNLEPHEFRSKSIRYYHNPRISLDSFHEFAKESTRIR